MEPVESSRFISSGVEANPRTTTFSTSLAAANTNQANPPLLLIRQEKPRELSGGILIDSQQSLAGLVAGLSRCPFGWPTI